MARIPSTLGGNSYDDSKVWCSVKKFRSGTAAVHRSNNVFMNKFGVFDLCGNVHELCLDGYQPYTKSFDRLGYVSVPTDPVGSGNVSKCQRGGSWNSSFPEGFRCTIREEKFLDYSIAILGFRLVAPPK